MADKIWLWEAIETISSLLGQDSTNGNFRVFLKDGLFSGSDKALENYLERTSAKALYINKTTQNMKNNYCRDEIQSNILNQNRNAGPFSEFTGETTSKKSFKTLLQIKTILEVLRGPTVIFQ